MQKLLLIGAIILPLAACSGGGEEQASAQDVAKAKPPLMQPGEWEIARTVTGYNFEGITAQEYQEKLGGTTSVKTCITPETADRPDPSFLATNQQTGRSEEHTSELQSLMRISYAVFCLKKKTDIKIQTTLHLHHI